MLKFTSIVGYTSCGPTYIESFLTIFGQCINVLNYNLCYYHLYLGDGRRGAGFEGPKRYLKKLVKCSMYTLKKIEKSLLYSNHE